MTDSELYSKEQIEKVRSILKTTVGEIQGVSIDGLEDRLNTRKIPDQNEESAPQKGQSQTSKKGDPQGDIDIDAAIESNNMQKMLLCIDDVCDDANQSNRVVDAMLSNKDTKSFQLVEALSKTHKHTELLDKIVDSLVIRKGVTSLIDALKFSKNSPTSVTKLATTISHNGSINHLIRSVASTPKDQPEAEMIMAMEIIARGTVQNIMDAISLLDAHSPGAIILVTGLVNRSEISIEPLVRALSAVKINHVASAVVAVKLAELSDTPTLVTLLEKYVSDSSSAGEILTCKLVYQSLQERERVKLMAKASRFMRKDSLSGKILAMGIIEQGNLVQMERAFNRMKAHPSGRIMIAVAIASKLSKLKAMKILGGLLFKISDHKTEARKIGKDARMQYELILKGDLGIDPYEEHETAKEKLAKDLKEQS